MPKPISLKPIQEGTRFRLNVPAILSPSGQRQRLYFPDIESARIKASELRARRHNLRIDASEFPEMLKPDALRAIELIRSVDPDATLLQAAKFFVDSAKAKARSISFLELFDLYLSLKSDRSESYRKELTITKNRLTQFHDQRVCDIAPEDIETFLAGISPASRNAILRYLKAIFNVGRRRGYLKSNPIDALEMTYRPRKEVTVLKPEEFERMLKAALESDLSILPYLVVCGYAGVRPEGEATRLEWRDYDWTEGKLEVRPEITKNNQRRFVELEPNACRWLEAYRARGGNISGILAPFTEKELRTHRESNRRLAEISHWGGSLLRHSYASYWCVLHDNVDRLLFMLGHSSLEMLRRHYRRAVPVEQAKKYFSILPPAPAENVIPISAASA
jgi:integrase